MELWFQWKRYDCSMSVKMLFSNHLGLNKGFMTFHCVHVLEDTCGIFTAYLISSKVMESGSKGRTIPLCLFWPASVMLPALDNIDLDDTLLCISFPFSAQYLILYVIFPNLNHKMQNQKSRELIYHQKHYFLLMITQPTLLF